MASFNFNDLPCPESLYSYINDCTRDRVAGLTPTFDPLNSLLPDPLQTEITTPLPSSESTDIVSPVSTDDEAAHVDDSPCLGFNAANLPLDFLMSAAAAAAQLFPDPVATVVPHPPPAPPTPLTASSVSPSPASSALFSPTTAYAAPSVSPPTSKRRFSLVSVDKPDQPQEPSPGPSDPRPVKRPCTSVPGESCFQLDPTVEPLQSTKSAGPPIGKPPRAARTDYSACRCPSGPTEKKARHWRVCPYNLNRTGKRFKCEQCDKQFTRDDNKIRHVKEYHD
ncbi:hypothetical protein FRC04_010220 [Tulasnella sp. 424]|nr:hypothetical protein FRC04_010220 [Tulasnella sp. 424]